MYLEAQRLKKVIQQVIDISGELNKYRGELLWLNRKSEAEINVEHLRVSIEDRKHTLKSLLDKLSTRELIIIRSIKDIGYSERGYRFYGGQKVETIIIEIRGTPQELLDKCSKYYKYTTKEQLIGYLTEHGLISEHLAEGMKILKL